MPDNRRESLDLRGFGVRLWRFWSVAAFSDTTPGRQIHENGQLNFVAVTLVSPRLYEFFSRRSGDIDRASKVITLMYLGMFAYAMASFKKKSLKWYG